MTRLKRNAALSKNYPMSFTVSMESKDCAYNFYRVTGYVTARRDERDNIRQAMGFVSLKSNVEPFKKTK